MGGGGEVESNFNPRCQFSVNNSKTLKAVALAFAAFSKISLETFVPNLLSLIWQNSDGCISDFRISCQFLIKLISFNSRTSDDIDMKLKLTREKKAMSKHFDDDVMSTNCDAILIFSNLRPIQSTMEAVTFNSNLLSYKK